MAIIIEEDKNNGGGWFGFIVLFVVLVVVGVSSYYLFFVKPDLIDVVAPVRLRSIDELVRMDFNPSDVVSSEFFRTLSPVVQPPSPPIPGNSSPFGVF